MSLDTVVLQALANECGPLAGSKIVAIEQHAANEIGLVLRGSTGRHALVFCVQPGSARVYMTSPGRRSEGSSAFLNAARECLLAGRFDSVEALPDDRILIVGITARTPNGVRSYQLIAELIDRHNMLVLASDPDLKIVETLRRVRTGGRDPSPGETYEFPVHHPKPFYHEISESDLSAAANEPCPQEMVRQINRDVGGLSPVIVREIVAAAGLSDGEAYQKASTEELQHRVWQSFTEAAALLSGGRWNPSVGFDEEANPVILSALPIVSLPENQVSVFESMSAAIEYFFNFRLEADRKKGREKDVRKVLADESSRLMKLIDNLWKDAAVSDREEEFRIFGELLTANLSELKFGQEEAIVRNYYDPEQASLTIRLDPAMSPADNAERYFKKARKARDGREIIEKRLLVSEERLDKIRHVLADIHDNKDEKAIRKAFYTCVRLGLLKPDMEQRKTQSARKKRSVDIHPRRFVTKDGSLVLVGRNNRENEVLTKTASPDDIWLHARDMGGSHVILKRSNKKEMPSKWTCYEAACVAAYFSKGRGSTTVPVDYTERRYVRKMKDGGPGKVIFTHEKTLFVAPKLELREEDSGLES